MFAFILGTVLGGAGLLVLLRVLAMRRDPLVGRLLGLPALEESTGEGGPDVAPGPPAVDPIRLPDVVTVEEVRAYAQTHTDLRQLIPDPDLARLVGSLLNWKPKRHRSEAKFQESFERFLVECGAFTDDEVVRHETVRFSFDGVHERIARPDFTVKGRVLVELKHGLTASGETDRALGQLLRYLRLWRTRGPALLVICSSSDTNMKDLTKSYVQGWKKQGLPVMALFVRDADASVLADVPSYERPSV